MDTTTIQADLSHPKYRPDIDGLRAVAVLAVVAFHAFPGWVTGGFIGVDIFFVISGYLISTIIFESLNKGTFNFFEFYSRRIRRIFPALLLVLIACFTFGWFALLADEYKQLGQHISGGAGFVSNFILWNEAGYFDNSAETKPLLHLWSLGIEEQFYIVWPLLLWFSWKRKFNLLIITIVVAAATFILNLKGVKQDMVATFYSPVSRFWELLSGSLLAWLTLYNKGKFSIILSGAELWLCSIVYRNKHKIDRNTLVNAVSFIGLFLLLYGFWRINKGLSFPGKWALVPVLGAVLIIAAGSKAWVNRAILSNKVLVWFGLISFPLYLWHWPLLSFARIVEGEVPSQNMRIGIVILSIALAWLTYRLVERPLRFGGHGKTKVAVLVVLMTIVGYVGYNTYERNGLLFRFDHLSEENRLSFLKIADAWKYRGYPAPENSFKDPKYDYLRIGSNDGYKILFIGDSHAQQYWNSVGGFAKSSQPKAAPSILFADLGFPTSMSEELLADSSIRVVVFSYFWAYKYGSSKVNQAVRCCASGMESSVGSSSSLIPVKSDKEMDSIDSNFLNLTTKLVAQKKKVFFILDNPFGEELDPHTMIVRSWNGFRLVPHNKLLKGEALDRSEPMRSRIIEIAKKGGAEIIDPLEVLCDNNLCSAFSINRDLLYKDYDHLSMFSSKYRTSYLAPIFKK